MTSFIQNPIAYGVRSEPTDTRGGPLGQELIAGAGIAIIPIDVGGGDIRLRISATGGAAGTYVGIVNPTPQNDDVDTAGLGRVFEVGDHWINSLTDEVFICVDNTTNAAIWSVVDMSTYLQETVNDNTTKIVVIGNKTQDSAYFINYIMDATTITARRAGVIYVGHNGTDAEARDEFTPINGIINVTVSASILGNDVRLSLQATTVGSNVKFRYSVTKINSIV